MELRPILSAMRRNKFGAILIATQMAVTLAFLVNALTLVEQREAWSARPSGIDEADIFVMHSENVDHPDDVAARQTRDVAALRALPGVVDAFATNMYPLEGGGWVETVNLAPDQKTPTAFAAHYMGDEHALNTMGLKLIAGRNFTAQEIANRSDNDIPPPAGFIVTKTLAAKLFPQGNALGQLIFVENEKPVAIIGIVDRLQGPMTVATGFNSTFAENSVLSPYRLIGERNVYMVRTRPGQRDAVTRAAEGALSQLDENRILQTRAMQQVRVDAYRGDHGLIVLLSAICTALLVVTAFGIIGLTSYWVAQRRQQIGIRRALGATRQAIVRYFQTENFMIAAAGAAIGIVFAIALNLWMVRSFEMVRMDNSRAIGGAIVILLLGQFAVLWPALRAASIPPALATRGG
ncbi:MAG: putative transport system permease protein [Gammaproteobacteria bacterium]|jgi:putative ABC transport system permease protein|nr:putative transport system permease protein [Gammaproteobacteria bacterium]